MEPRSLQWLWCWVVRWLLETIQAWNQAWLLRVLHVVSIICKNFKRYVFENRLIMALFPTILTKLTTFVVLPFAFCLISIKSPHSNRTMPFPQKHLESLSGLGLATPCSSASFSARHAAYGIMQGGTRVGCHKATLVWCLEIQSSPTGNA